MAKQLKLFEKSVKSSPSMRQKGTGLVGEYRKKTKINKLVVLAKRKGNPSTPSAYGGLRSGNKKGDSSRSKTSRTVRLNSNVTVRAKARIKNNSTLKIKGRSDATIGAKTAKRSWYWTDYFVSSPLKITPKKKRTTPVVFVMMSGGVDSSATAYLLKQQGFEVVGVYMKNWSFPIKKIKECPLYDDYKNMVKVCKFLKIPYQVWSFEKDYRKRVIDPFFKGYEEGITPNPDVLCNTEIKFDDFFKKAMKMGADYIATGHHIRSRCADPKSFKLTSSVIPTSSSVIPSVVEGSRDSSTSSRKDSAQNDKKSKGKNTCLDYQLLKGKDPIKDQTYFVYRLTQDQLKKCIFPVGDYVKTDLRALAKKVNLPTAERRDSQGICFIGNINVKSFLKTRLPEKEGDIVTKDGKKVGRHEGAWFYTIGQRRIEGLSGMVKPMYVIGKNMKKNQVIVGDDKDTYAKIARLTNFHLINGSTRSTSSGQASAPFNKVIQPKDLMSIVLTAKSRYTPETTRGKLDKDKKGYFFEFIKPERAITPGQSLVLYKGDVCLGGGIITKAE